MSYPEVKSANYWLQKMVEEKKAKEIEIGPEKAPPLNHVICGDDSGKRSYAFVNDTAYNEYRALVFGFSRAYALIHAAKSYSERPGCKGQCELFPECRGEYITNV